MDDLPDLFVGVYLLYAGDDLVYIGESGNIPVRLKQHRRQKKWFPTIDRIRGIWFQEIDTRLTAETILILKHRPRENRAVKLGIDKQGRIYPLNFIRGRRG